MGLTICSSYINQMTQTSQQQDNFLFTIKTPDYENEDSFSEPDDDTMMYDIRYYNNTLETLKQLYSSLSELVIMFLKKSCKRVTPATLTDAIALVSEEHKSVIQEILLSETAIGCGCDPSYDHDFDTVVNSLTNIGNQTPIRTYNEELLHSAVKLLIGHPLNNERRIDLSETTQNMYNYIIYYGR